MCLHGRKIKVITQRKECAFDQFPKYHMRIFLYFNAEVGRDTFKPAIGNENLCKNVTVASTVFTHHKS